MAGVLNPSGKIIGSGSQVLRSACDFRLTLESNVPISTSNQEAKTSLIMTPHIGKQIALLYNNTWMMCETEEISLSLASYTANKNYDVWAYWNGSAVVLDSTIWTNDSTRSVDLVRKDGVYTKTGEANKKYIGTIRITGSTGQCEDSLNARYVWNMYNRVPRTGMCGNTTNTWSYTGTSTRECNAGTGQLRFKFVAGISGGNVHISAWTTYTYCNAGLGYYSGPSNIDQTAACACQNYVIGSNTSYGGGWFAGVSYDGIGAGYHFITSTETGNTGGSAAGYASATSPGYMGGSFIWMC